MATNTYTVIDTKTIAVAASSISFTSIPQTYTDLVLVSNFGTSVTTQTIEMRVNGDTSGSTNYSWTWISGNGSVTTSTRGSNDNRIPVGFIGPTTTINANSIIQIMNYANTTTNKTILGRLNTSDRLLVADVGLYRSTNAISSIQFYTQGGNFNVGSTFSLYGILAEVGGSTPKATGGVVTSDATYWYHTFNDSGNFTPNQSITCDYLVVAGGGGGGTEYGGGGGAGGFRTSIGGSALSLTAQNYAVLIGAGGPGGPTAGTNGSNGGNSIFSTITSTGGGGGGANSSTTAPPNGVAGGSGGGGGVLNYGGGFITSSGGSGTAGQGNNGGIGGRLGGGGGGGASAVGANYTTSPGTGQIADNKGNGGAGTASSINGTSVTYAGGGGGMGWSGTTVGGAGGGGAGSYVSGANAVAGTANTGGGGGGGSAASTSLGAAGGSGVVILRYVK
jgi:hypothetical protein